MYSNINITIKIIFLKTPDDNKIPTISNCYTSANRRNGALAKVDGFNAYFIIMFE